MAHLPHHLASPRQKNLAVWAAMSWLDASAYQGEAPAFGVSAPAGAKE